MTVVICERGQIYPTEATSDCGMQYGSSMIVWQKKIVGSVAISEANILNGFPGVGISIMKITRLWDYKNPPHLDVVDRYLQRLQSF